MKVDLEWGEKNTEGKYRVEGADLESAFNFLNRREEWGNFKWRFAYRGKANTQGIVTSLTIILSFTITMPNWPAYRRQPQRCKDEWDDMWKALWKHENTHRTKFEGRLSNLKRDWEALERQTVREIESLKKAAYVAIQKDIDDYDRETNHGRDRGVELTIWPECRSKSPGGKEE